MSHIFHKILATGRPVAKTLIKYNRSCSEKNNEKEKEPIDIEFTDQNSDPEMMKMLLTLDDRVEKKKMRRYYLVTHWEFAKAN